MWTISKFSLTSFGYARNALQSVEYLQKVAPVSCRAKNKMASVKTRIRNKKRLAICGLGALLLLQNRAVRKRKWWVRPWATDERRQNQGMANNLVGELRLTDPGSFQNFLR